MNSTLPLLISFFLIWPFGAFADKESLCSGPLLEPAFDDGLHDLGMHQYYGPKEILDMMKALGKLSPNGNIYAARIVALEEKVRSWHRHKIEELNSHHPFPRRGFRNSIDTKEVLEIVKYLEDNSVTSSCVLHKYDLAQRLDLCFGRAAVAYVEARLKGLHQSSVKKIWMMGKFRAPNVRRWNYHVATVIFTNEGWRVIDPVLFPGSIVTIGEWHREMMNRSLAMDHNVVPRLFVTSGSRLMLYKHARYHHVGDTEDLLSRTFFYDYLALKKREFSAAR